MHAVEFAKVAQGTPEWLAARKNGIASSDAAPALGLSRYKSPFILFGQKRGEIPEEPENWNMRRGTALEPAIRQHYADLTGETIYLPTGILQHPEHKFMLASLDGYTENGRLFEAKTARQGDGWGMPGTDEIPQEYIVQVQHALCVTGLAVCDVMVSISGDEPRNYIVEADPEFHQMLVEREADMWRRITDNDPPDPASSEDVILLHRKPRPGNITATEEIVNRLVELVDIKTRLKALEEDKEKVEEIIKIFMGGYEELISDRGAVMATWKFGKESEKFDKKALKERYPQVYAALTTIGDPVRRFLVK